MNILRVILVVSFCYSFGFGAGKKLMGDVQKKLQFIYESFCAADAAKDSGLQAHGPRKYIDSKIRLTVGSMAFKDAEQEKQFHEKLEKQQREFQNLFWKNAEKGPYKKQELLKVIRGFDITKDRYKSEMLACNPPCALTADQRTFILVELQ